MKRPKKVFKQSNLKFAPLDGSEGASPGSSGLSSGSSGGKSSTGERHINNRNSKKSLMVNKLSARYFQTFNLVKIYIRFAYDEFDFDTYPISHTRGT